MYLINNKSIIQKFTSLLWFSGVMDLMNTNIKILLKLQQKSLKKLEDLRWFLKSTDPRQGKCVLVILIRPLRPSIVSLELSQVLKCTIYNIMHELSRWYIR